MYYNFSDGATSQFTQNYAEIIMEIGSKIISNNWRRYSRNEAKREERGQKEGGKGTEKNGRMSRNRREGGLRREEGGSAFHWNDHREL